VSTNDNSLLVYQTDAVVMWGSGRPKTATCWAQERGRQAKSGSALDAQDAYRNATLSEKKSSRQRNVDSEDLIGSDTDWFGVVATYL